MTESQGYDMDGSRAHAERDALRARLDAAREAWRALMWHNPGGKTARELEADLEAALGTPPPDADALMEARKTCAHCGKAQRVITAHCPHGDEQITVDACIADLLVALQHLPLSMRTVQSCCGHGRDPGQIHLADGRALLVMSWDEAGRIVGPLRDEPSHWADADTPRDAADEGGA